jgi:raffinose/stachyose/melibiose transport system substrate-binding protein
VDCFPFPAVSGGPDGAERIVLGGINAAYAVSSSCVRRKSAVELIGDLTGDLSEIGWGLTGRIPALRRELAEGMIAPEAAKAAALIYDAPAIQLYYDQALPAALSEAHKSTTQALLSLAITPEEAARQMEKASTEK